MIFQQGPFTLLVHAHAGRTQYVPAGLKILDEGVSQRMNRDESIYSEKDYEGLRDALNVAQTGNRSEVTEGDEKLLGFFLRHGECDAWITDKPVIEVVFSWLNKRKPSTYFSSLAPGLLTQLMDLGGVRSISDSIEFSVGPGTSGTNRYRIEFERKWVWISCADDAILIRVRDRRSSLKSPLRPGEPTTAH